MFRRAVEVGEGTWRATGEGYEAAWSWKVGGGAFDLRTEVRGVTPPPNGPARPEAALAAALLPALRTRRPIRATGLPSERLVAALPRIQDALCERHASWHPVRVRHTAGHTAGQATADRGAGMFLSLGVDSFYSLLLQRRSITDLVLVHGLDVPLTDEELWAQAVAAAEEVAAWTAKRLVLVRTNVRSLLEPYVDGAVSLDTGLAHVALCLTPWLERVTLGSRRSEEAPAPQGSHPDILPLWSTEDQEIVVHGGDVRRTDKLAYLAREKAAMDHLRVCGANADGAYNCGRCPSCLLVMLGLEIVGGLQACRTLPHPIPEDALRAVDTWGRPSRRELEALRDAWREQQPGSRMLAEIEAAIARELAADGS